ncbi:MAG: tRNA (guanosine(46)-N7)-methyltransferase TrmB [Bacilli bacterium]|nr:tRNA (guanosine(46)-N7)-methyltransferase TrmB [Bacilli bacterium]
MRLRNVKDAANIIDTSKYIVLEPSKYKGSWQSLFNNNNPIYIEIGMGKGQFILNNALNYPNINFIGIEKFDSVMVRAVNKIDENELLNLRLIKIDALEINDIFDHEIDLIYLNFSDPWPKDRHEKRRLTSKPFLDLYDNIFKDKKLIHLKTDNKPLYEYSLLSLTEAGYILKSFQFDLKSLPNANITTEYEDRFLKLNKPIFKIEAFK